MQNPMGAIGASRGIRHFVPPLHTFDLNQIKNWLLTNILIF